MYEEKAKKLNINWKSLLVKMIVLLFAVFVILWLVSLVNRKNNKPSNLNTNLKLMQNAANEYFTESKLPTTVNGKKKITLGEMFDSKILIEFKDQNNKSCDTKESYAEATKLNAEDYNIKIKLVCGEESDYIIDKVTIAKNDNITTIPDDNNNQDNNTTIVDNNVGNGNSNNTTPNTTKPNTTTITNTTKPNTSTSSSNNNQTTTIASTCNYGNKEYINYVLSYEIPGNCAVSKNDYNKATYSNAANAVAAAEYQKIVKEMSSYNNIIVESPSFKAVYNKANTGFIGYQMLFTVKRKNNYVLETVYQYYLNKDGSRKVITDKRNTLNTNNSSNNNTTNINKPITTSKIILNTSSLNLIEGDTYALRATLNPSNSTSGITWSSDNTAVATINSNGLVTAKKAGYATITVKSGNAISTARVIVTPKIINVDKIVINSGNLSLNVNDSYYLSVSVTPSNATNKTIYYYSSNSNIATVNASGLVTAKKSGTAIIYAESNGIRTSIYVYVNEIKKNTYCKRVVQYDYFMIAEKPNSYSKYNFTIQYNKKDMKDVQVYSAGYLTHPSQYEDALNYFNNKERIYFIKNMGTFNYILPTDYSKYTLKQENFSQTISSAYQSNGTWNIDITYQINNYNNTTPYHYSPTTDLYFVPTQIILEYIDLGNCINIQDSEAYLYRNYKKI